MLLISSDLNINNTDLPLREENIDLSIKKVPKRIVSKEVDEKYEEQFQELYRTNKEFSNKINSDMKYKKSISFKSKYVCLHDYIDFLDIEYLLYTKKEFKELYENNKKFKKLYIDYWYFRNKYDSDIEYRNKINNNEEFIDLQYLLYTNKQFKELYDNYEEFKNKYDSDIKYRKNIKDKDDIEYINNIHNKDNKKYSFLLLQYALYTDIKFKKLYDSNKDFQNVAEQIDLCTDESFKVFRLYDSFIEHYCNNKEFQEKIYNDKEFMIDQIILYSNNHFIYSYYNNRKKQFKNAYDNDEDFRTAYRSSAIFRYNYHECAHIFNCRWGRVFKYIEKIHSDKEFFKLIVYVTNDPELYNIYKNDIIFSDLYDNKQTFQKLFLKLYKNNVDFKNQYNTDATFRENFRDSQKFREQCEIFFAKNLTTKF